MSCEALATGPGLNRHWVKAFLSKPECHPHLRGPEAPLNCISQGTLCRCLAILVVSLVTPLWLGSSTELGCGVVTGWSVFPEGSHPLYPRSAGSISAQGSREPLLHLGGVTYQVSIRLLEKPNHSREDCTLTHQHPLSLLPRLGLLTSRRASQVGGPGSGAAQGPGGCSWTLSSGSVP